MELFDLQPTLTGNLIELRALKGEDFRALFEAARDPLIWDQHNESDRYQLEVFQKFFDRAIASRGALAIVDLKSKRIIGSSAFYDWNPAQREIAIGLTLLERAFWGGPYNRELKSLMLNHAFRFVDRVLFQVAEQNLPSQKALQKMGARLVTRTELPRPDGTMSAFLRFAIEPTPLFGFIPIDCPVHLASLKPACLFKTYSIIWRVVRRWKN